MDGTPALACEVCLDALIRKRFRLLDEAFSPVISLRAVINSNICNLKINESIIFGKKTRLYSFFWKFKNSFLKSVPMRMRENYFH
jgi:hypothetical protein